MSPSSPIGLIAGKGKFPLIFARECRKDNRDLVIVALKEEVDEDLAPYAKSVHFISTGKLDSIIGALKKEGVTEAVMAGRGETTHIFSDIISAWGTTQLLFT